MFVNYDLFIMTYSSFEEIPVWQSSRVFVMKAFDLVRTNKFLQKDYGTSDQFRRAASSILLNISEGFERGSNVEFAHYINIAKASAGEIRAILYIMVDAQYIDRTTFDKMHSDIREISTHLANFRKFLLRNKHRKK